MYIMIISHWAILHNMYVDSKQLQESLMVFCDDFLALSEDQEKNLSNSKTILTGF